jgi:hypothetical protein
LGATGIEPEAAIRRPQRSQHPEETSFFTRQLLHKRTGQPSFVLASMQAEF